MIVKIIFFCLLASAFAEVVQIHDDLTPEEVKSIFGTNYVPEHEVVPVAISELDLSSNNEGGHSIVQLNTFSVDIRLYLEPVDSLLAGVTTPVWMAYSKPEAPEGIYYKRIKTALAQMHQIYQDRINMAAITVDYDDNGKTLMYGTIGDNLIIHPLPSRLRENFTRKRRSLEEEILASNRTVNPSNFKDTYHHIVFKRSAPKIDFIRRNVVGSIKNNEISEGTIKLEVPDVVHPEVLVILDYEEYQSFKTMQKALSYVISFWNAVDLRYRIFAKPSIRLNIAGIILPGDRNSTPYITKNYINTPDKAFDERQQLDSDGTLKDMARYFYRESMQPTLKRFVIEQDFDIAVLMTQCNMCTRESDIEDDYSCDTLGYTYRNGACTVKPKGKELAAIAIVEDDAGFRGIIPTAHEVGHLMGAYHDGHKTARDCSPYLGYIMTAELLLTKNTFMWSWCSINEIHEFFRSERSQCTYNAPEVGVQVKKLLPGKIITLHQQCDRLQGSFACNANSDVVCHRLECYIHDTGHCIGITPAAEGSSCGHKKHCINGSCISLNETSVIMEQPTNPEESNSITDYFNKIDEARKR